MEERFASRGLALRVAFEPEFYLLIRTDDGYQPAARAKMFTLNALETQRQLMSLVLTSLAEMGVELEQVAPEFGPGQFEINIRHQPPLRAADDLMTVKEELRALAPPCLARLLIVVRGSRITVSGLTSKAAPSERDIHFCGDYSRAWNREAGRP
jgi:hypothetical protein